MLDGIDEQAVEASVGGELGVEAGRHEVAVAHEHRLVVVATPAPRRPAPTVSMRGARMNTPWNGSANPSTSRSASKLSIWRP